MLFHLASDDQMKEMYEECKGGSRSCGTCKNMASELMFNFLKEHQKERKHAEERLKEYGINQ